MLIQLPLGEEERFLAPLSNILQGVLLWSVETDPHREESIVRTTKGMEPQFEELSIFLPGEQILKLLQKDVIQVIIAHQFVLFQSSSCFETSHRIVNS